MSVAVSATAHPDPLGRSLGWTLDRLLPGPGDTQLLLAVLHRGEEAVEAWQSFRASIPEHRSLFRTDTGWRKRLSPLLLLALREGEIEADASLLTLLRTAYVREELRERIYREILGDVLDRLREVGVRFLVLKGAALSQTSYPDPVLRHAHDIDLLLPPQDVDAAAHGLLEMGLRRVGRLSGGQGWDLRHSSALPVLLHTELFRLSFYRADFESLWERARGARLADRSVRVPCFSDQLLHSLGHASYCPSRSTLLWVTDAWMIMNRSHDLDWSLFVTAAARARLQLPVFVMLRYLREELEAPVPESTLLELGRMAGRADAVHRDVALLGARSRLRRAESARRESPGTWRHRLAEAWWQLFPSRAYLRWAYASRRPMPLPVLYLSRPLTHAVEVLRWKGRRASSVRLSADEGKP